ncbi:cache domain-containing protein [Amphritea sp. HPY]|uniref:sensor domain-containing diguanylate cyclase n=1 Tax=Amphritea sp. HPY TaxID=3421652 RepID=UPI003D7CBB24
MSLHISPHRISRYILWGVSAIVIIMLIAIVAYFIVNDRQYYQQQLDSLQQTFLEEQRLRLNDELDDAETFIQLSNASAEETLRHESQSQVRQALSVMRSIYEQQQHKMPEAELQQLLIESVRDLRFFNGRGYIFIDDMNGVCILLPTAPGLEGTSLYDNQDDTGHYIMRGLIDAVRNPEQSGFSRYRWYPPENEEEMADKIAYVERFQSYNWIVGGGDYIYRIEQDLQLTILRHLKNIRFDNNGYIAVLKNNGVVQASAASPQLEGMHFEQFSNASDQESARRVLEIAKDGGGYLYYDWTLPGQAKRGTKLSLVRPLKHWDWILVAGIYEDDIESLIQAQKDELDRQLQENTRKLLLLLVILCAAVLMVTRLFSRWLSSQFDNYHSSIEQQKNQLVEYAQSMELSARIVEAAYEGIAVMDRDNKILQVNDAFSRITGYSSDEAVGQNPKLLASGKHDSAYYHQMWQELLTQGGWQGEIWNKRKDGTVYPEWLSITAYLGPDGQIQNFIATFTDITRRKAAEKRLRILAENDPLTELPNRRSLMLYLERDIAIYQRYQTPQLAVMFIDLDRFKEINDNFGHDVGDMVLIEVARRLKDTIRVSDIACRIGGDEFVLIAKQLPQDADNGFEPLADRLVKVFSEPMVVKGERLLLSASVGVVICNDNESDAQRLMKKADQALYRAKNNGRAQAFICQSDTELNESKEPA